MMNTEHMSNVIELKTAAPVERVHVVVEITNVDGNMRFCEGEQKILSP